MNDCQFGVSPVNYSDSDSDSDVPIRRVRHLVAPSSTSGFPPFVKEEKWNLDRLNIQKFGYPDILLVNQLTLRV